MYTHIKTAYYHMCGKQYAQTLCACTKARRLFKAHARYMSMLCEYSVIYLQLLEDGCFVSMPTRSTFTDMQRGEGEAGPRLLSNTQFRSQDNLQ